MVSLCINTLIHVVVVNPLLSFLLKCRSICCDLLFDSIIEIPILFFFQKHNKKLCHFHKKILYSSSITFACAYVRHSQSAVYPWWDVFWLPNLTVNLFKTKVCDSLRSKTVLDFHWSWCQIQKSQNKSQSMPRIAMAKLLKM